jgi:hypothetical protein
MPALSLLTKSATYTNGNPNDADEVELDLANAYANFAAIQTDYNNLVTNAYTIAGVKTFSSTPKMDAIAEVTSGNGVVVDSLKIKDGSLILPTATELTIASGAITVTQGFHTVDTESDAATDNLDTINGVAAGQIVYLKAADAARDVVLTNGVGNVYTPAGSSVTLSNTTQGLAVMGDGTNVFVLGAPVSEAVKHLPVVSVSGASAIDMINIPSTCWLAKLLYEFTVSVDGVVIGGRVSHDNGVNFAAGASDYAWSSTGRDMTTTATAVGLGDNLHTSIQFNGASSGVGNAAGERAEVVIELLQPNDATHKKAFAGDFIAVTGSGVSYWNGFGGRYLAADTAINAFRTFPASGTITGTVRGCAFLEV